MGKLIKILLSIVLILVVLIVAAVIIVPLVVDPNDYKDEIVALVKDKTGRNLEIGERMDLSVFPWLGVRLGKVTVGNAAGFGDDPFARVQELDVRVKVIPLLSRRVEVDTLVLDGLELNLARDQQGVSNWDDLVAKAKPAEEKKEAEAEPKAEQEAVGLDQILIGGVRVERGRFTWDDRQAGAKYTLDDVRLVTGAISPGESVPLEMGLRLRSEEPQLETVFAGKGTLGLDDELQRFSLPDLKLSLDAQGEGLPADGLSLRAAAALILDAAAGNFALDGLRVDGPAMALTGQLKGTGLNAQPVINGELNLTESNPRELLAMFGATVETTDPEVMSRAAGRFALKADGKSASIDDLQLQLDDTSLNGKLSVTDFAGPAVRFTVDVDQFDLDRYLPPPAEQPAAGPAETSAEPAPSAQPGAADKPSFDGLRKLDVDGRFSVGQFKAYGARVSDVSIVVKANNGVLRIDPLTGALYDGKVHSVSSLDVRSDTPRIALKQRVTGVQAAPLLKDMLGQDRVSGTANMQADITMQGMSDVELKRSLNGTASVSFSEGAVKGVNIARAIRLAYAKLKGLPPPPEEPEQTDFSELSGSAVIKNGVIDNQDLKAKSPLLRIEGRGSVDLPADQLDYLVDTRIVGTLKGQGGEEGKDLRNIPVPVRLTGSLQDPKAAVDVAELAKALAQQRLEKEADKLLDRVLPGASGGEAGDEPASAQDRLKKDVGDALKGLFKR